MRDNLEAYDTSNYPSDHPCFSKTNAKVLGKMKDECASLPAQEFIGLRSKMYSISLPQGKTKKTCKGVKTGYCNKHIIHSDYMKTLVSRKTSMATYNKFQSKAHQIHSVRITKISLSPFDDKRYILDDGISSLAYGHHRIEKWFVYFVYICYEHFICFLNILLFICLMYFCLNVRKWCFVYNAMNTLYVFGTFYSLYVWCIFCLNVRKWFVYFCI